MRTVIIAIAKVKKLKCHLRRTLNIILGTSYSLVRPLLMLIILIIIIIIIIIIITIIIIIIIMLYLYSAISL